jgi:hypothetical protein
MTVAMRKVNLDRPTSTKYVCKCCGHHMAQNNQLITHSKLCGVKLYNILERLKRGVIPDDIFNDSNYNEYLLDPINLNRLEMNSFEVKRIKISDMIKQSEMKDLQNKVIYPSENNNSIDETSKIEGVVSQTLIHTSEPISYKLSNNNNLVFNSNKLSYVDEELDEILYIPDTFDNMIKSDNINNTDVNNIINDVNNDVNVDANDDVDDDIIIKNNYNIEYNMDTKYFNSKDLDLILNEIKIMDDNNTTQHFIKFKDKIYSKKFDYYEHLYIEILYDKDCNVIDIYDVDSSDYIRYINKLNLKKL